MQPNLGSSSGLAKETVKDLTQRTPRKAETTAETQSPQRKSSWAQRRMGVRRLAATFASYDSSRKAFKARPASSRKKREQALALHMDSRTSPRCLVRF